MYALISKHEVIVGDIAQFVGELAVDTLLLFIAGAILGAILIGVLGCVLCVFGVVADILRCYRREKERDAAVRTLTIDTDTSAEAEPSSSAAKKTTKREPTKEELAKGATTKPSDPRSCDGCRYARDTGGPPPCRSCTRGTVEWRPYWEDFWEPKLFTTKKRKPRKPAAEPRNPSKCDTCRYNDPEVESRPCGFCRHRPADSVYGVGWPDYWEPKAEEPKPSAASSDNVCTEGDGHGTTEGG